MVPTPRLMYRINRNRYFETFIFTGGEVVSTDFSHRYLNNIARE